MSEPRWRSSVLGERPQEGILPNMVNPNSDTACRLLWQAQAFKRTAEVLPPPGTPPEDAPVFLGFMVAQIVNACFSAELFFKALIALEGNPVPREHRLDALLRALSTELRDRIGVLWLAKSDPMRSEALAKASGSEVPTSLEGVLSEAASAFVAYRYANEEGPNRPLPNVHLGPLLGILEAEVQRLSVAGPS